MILYFSGTGNSRYVARIIAEEINDEIISINELLKHEYTEELISTDRPFIFVYTTYAWRLPKVVTDFIRRTKFCGSNKAYFIMTCGEDTSKVINYIQKLCNDKGWQLKSMAEVIMPENYIALFDVPDKETSNKIIEESSHLIYKIASDIRDEKDFEIFKPSGFGGTVKSGITNIA